MLLRAHVGEDEVVVGTPVSGRERPELAGLIGFFTNTLVLRCDLAAGPTFRQLVQRLWGEVRGALAHQDLPFEKLVEELHPDRDLAQNPCSRCCSATGTRRWARGCPWTAARCGRCWATPARPGSTSR
ncbi:hypothetical protein GCM10029964_028760 [Kibdelosporangium lantanae]